MDAGRELDALVAEKVMGWTRYEGESIPPPAKGAIFAHRDPAERSHQTVWIKDGQLMACSLCGTMPRWSEDIAAAWEVVDKVRLDGWYVEILFMDSAGWRVCLWKGEERKWFPKQEARAIYPDAPVAICLTALKAVGGGTPQRNRSDYERERADFLRPLHDWLRCKKTPQELGEPDLRQRRGARGR